MDETEKTQGGETGESSAQTSDEAKATSQVKDEAKAKSDELAKQGRERKAATDKAEAEALRAENTALKDKLLASAATKYGKSLEEVKAAGITTAEQLDTMAGFFGTGAPTSKSTFQKAPDSGKNSGTGGPVDFSKTNPSDWAKQRDQAYADMMAGKYVKK